MSLLNRICYYAYMALPMRSPAWVSDRAIQHMDIKRSTIRLTVGRLTIRHVGGSQTGIAPPITVSCHGDTLSEAQWIYVIHSMAKKWMENTDVDRLEFEHDGCRMLLKMESEQTESATD